MDILMYFNAILYDIYVFYFIISLRHYQSIFVFCPFYADSLLRCDSEK